MNRGAWWSHKDLDKTEQLTLSKDRGRQAVLTLTHTHTDTQTHTHTHTHTHGLRKSPHSVPKRKAITIVSILLDAVSMFPFK